MAGLGEGDAQPLTLRNGAINSGGAIAHGGPFSVAASSGQTTSGTPSGGGFSVQSGESSGAAPFTVPIVPMMVMTQTGPAGLVVAWVPLVPGYVLEFTDTLQSPRWFPYPFASGGTNVHSILGGSRQLFFRLKKTGPPIE